MVGPGTGVSPFIGFLQHKACLMKQNPSVTWPEWWLFFGCRHPEKDYIYRTDLEEMVANGVLNKLVAAFSRETAEKVYVQHKMLEHGEAVHEMIQRNAYIYVCGDAKGMSKGMTGAITAILQKHGNCDPTTAQEKYAELLKNGRLLFYVWS